MSASTHPGRPESGADPDGVRPVASESLLLAAKRTLEMIAAGASLGDTLTALCAAIDAQSPDITSTVLLADPDGKRLWPAAGPRVARGWREALSPAMIGPDMGSCGTAAFLKERVIISDVATDPRCSGVAPTQSPDVAIAYGIRAAWSEPLVSKDNELLGTFALYYGDPRSPTGDDLRLIEEAAQLALIAIEADRSQAALKKAVQEARGIVDAIPQSIAVLSPDGMPLYGNRSLLEYTGLTIDEVMSATFRTRAFHPDDVTRLLDERRDALTRGVPFELEQRARRHDGQYRWFLVQYRPVRDEQGRTVRWYATGTDIDDRKRTEERTRNENLALREDIDRESMFEEIVGSSATLRVVLGQVAKVAPTDATVLILGETGTGKELIARAIHKRSKRSARAFIRVNCAAIPTSLIASELFGHEKGAFTGALQRRLGRFEAADGGTILLDEIGDLPAETQVTLLRVLQEREIERVGSSHPTAVDVRVIVATNKDLEAAVASGDFREDLYYRLNVVPICIPPLRERLDDLPILIEYLVERYASKAGKNIKYIDQSTTALFQAYHWPGNVRELQNVIERAVVLCDGETFSIDPSWLKRNAGGVSTQGAERASIESALRESEGRIAGPRGAAVKLGIPRQTLDSRIRALDIDKLKFKRR